MVMHTAINCWYRHPGRTQACLRAYMKDTLELVQTHAGHEISLGPVEFSTDFGASYSGTKAHGGWNYDERSVWFAFNCRGSARTAWKIVFYAQPDGSYIAEHPYEVGVQVSLGLVSLERWTIRVPRSWSLGAWLPASRSSAEATGAGYLGVVAGQELQIRYQGTQGDEEDWVYATSKAEESGWVSKACFETAGWELVEKPTSFPAVLR